MSAAGFTGFGGGTASAQQPADADIYSRMGGQPNVDSNPFTEGYQPPTASPMQPAAMPAPGSTMPGGKSGFMQGPQLGGGPAPVVDPNAVNPLGPTGQQPMQPQQNASQGGKGGFGGQPQFTQEQLQNFASQLFRQ